MGSIQLPRAIRARAKLLELGCELVVSAMRWQPGQGVRVKLAAIGDGLLDRSAAATGASIGPCHVPVFLERRAVRDMVVVYRLRTAEDPGVTDRVVNAVASQKANSDFAYELQQVDPGALATLGGREGRVVERLGFFALL